MRGASASLRAASRLGLEGVVWFGTRGSLEAALADSCPGLTLTLAEARGTWPKLLSVARRAGPASVLAWTGVHDPVRELWIRLVAARAGAEGPAFTVMLRPTVPTPGLWAIEPDQRATPPARDRLAELLGGEPSALARARELITSEVDVGALVSRIENAPDPAAEVARCALDRGAIDLEQVVQAKLDVAALRGLWDAPPVVARRESIRGQIAAALVQRSRRRRFMLEPMDRPIEAPDAALWSVTAEGAEEWGIDPRWPLVFRHRHLLIGLVRAAERDPHGRLWWRLAHRAPELPFPAPTLGWARRYAAIDREGGDTLVATRFQEAVTRAALRGDFTTVGALVVDWQHDLPGGWGAIKALLLAAIVGDDATALGADPAEVGARAPALEAELLRLRGLVLRRRGQSGAAERDLRAALALERRWGRGRDLAPWASLLRVHDAGVEAPLGTAVTRIALATLLSERGAFDEAQALLTAGAEAEAEAALPNMRAAQASIAGARGDWVSALRHFEAAVQLAIGDPPVEARLRARFAMLLRRLGDLSHAGEEARLAWAACLVGAPVHRRLAVGLVVIDLLEPEARVALEAHVLAELDRLPPALPARVAWEARLRSAKPLG